VTEHRCASAQGDSPPGSALQLHTDGEHTLTNAEQPRLQDKLIGSAARTLWFVTKTSKTELFVIRRPSSGARHDANTCDYRARRARLIRLAHQLNEARICKSLRCKCDGRHWIPGDTDGLLRLDWKHRPFTKVRRTWRRNRIDMTRLGLAQSYKIQAPRTT
jgi:hypothetical protein